MNALRYLGRVSCVAALLGSVGALAACSKSAPTNAGTGPGSGGPRSGPDTVGPGHDWTQFDWNVGRSGTSTAPTEITASNVGSLERQQVQLPGTVDAAAIYLSDVPINGIARDAFFVTTTYGKTLAIDANTGAILWTYTPSGYSSWAGSAQITTATPVADPDRQHVYTASPDGHVQKLSVADGSAAWSTAVTLSPASEKIASSLNYFAGHILAVTGGFVGDAPPYQGHIVILDAASGRVLHVWNSLCSNQHSLVPATQCAQSGSAIWGRAGAVVDSATGDIYIATGNGLWDGNTNWGDAMLRLDSSATQILGNYTPTNTASLARQDLDLGSTSPVLLGGGYVVQGGKDGSIRVISTAATGGSTPHEGGEAQIVSTPSGTDLFSAPALIPSGLGAMLVAADNNGTAAWSVSGGRLNAAWQNGNAGTSPIVAGGLLYVYDPTGGGLRVYQPASGALIATLSCGSGHWNSPIVIDGRIALPEGSSNDHQTSGVLDIWRIP
jgi:outer membrane protein assembly factor BamB